MSRVREWLNEPPTLTLRSIWLTASVIIISLFGASDLTAGRYGWAALELGTVISIVWLRNQGRR